MKKISVIKVKDLVLAFFLLVLVGCVNEQASIINTRESVEKTSIIEPTNTQTPNPNPSPSPSPTATPFITSINFEECRVINWIEGKEVLWFGVDNFSSIPVENFEVEVNIDKLKVENGLVTLSINNNPLTASMGTILSIYVLPYNTMDELSTSREPQLSYEMWYSTLLDTYVHPNFFLDPPCDLNYVNVDMNGAVRTFSFANEDYCYTNRLKLDGEICQIDVYPNGSEIAWGMNKDGNIICPIMK